jgi:hypothetical protein
LGRKKKESGPAKSGGIKTPPVFTAEESTRLHEIVGAGLNEPDQLEKADFEFLDSLWAKVDSLAGGYGAEPLPADKWQRECPANLEPAPYHVVLATGAYAVATIIKTEGGGDLDFLFCLPGSVANPIPGALAPVAWWYPQPLGPSLVAIPPMPRP